MVDVLDNLENYTIVNYTDSETNGQTSKLIACDTESDASENPLLLFTQPGCERQLERQRAARGQDDFFNLVSTVATPVTAIEDLRVINKATWDITDNIMVKNILSYSHLETDNGSDIFGTQFTETQAALISSGVPGGAADPDREFVVGASVVAPDVPVTSQETQVAELQVQGVSFASRLVWQAGVYYENSQPDGFSGNNAPVVVSCEMATLESPNPEDFNCSDPTGGVLGGVIQPRVKTEFTDKAVYGQATYDFFEWLSLTAGARYTWDVTDGEIVFTLHNFVGTERQEPIVSHESASQFSEAPTGLVELQYRPFADVMIYAKYTRGYRQGSVNMLADAGIQKFNEETVDVYELGAKTSFEWLISGRFNFSVFDNDLKDMQLQTGYVSPEKGASLAIFNAGSAEIRGMEAEASFQLLEDLNLNLSYSRLLTELLEQEDPCAEVEEAAGMIGGATCSPNAKVGDTLPFAQEKAGTASLNYRLPLPPAVGTISVGGTYIFVGEQRASASGTTPFDRLDSYSLLNLNMSWKTILGFPLDLSLFGTNVRDEEFVTFVNGGFNSLGFETGQVGLPRMYGARLRYSF